ncbi:SpoIIE family protein phosphatase [Yinghuangia sp. ASG 101]|uniref:SpoIIE family protein phosphatase n=1 Tax=Yinghuangia sp. ASG 101 TaxID=2896848 RepID=UPI001E400D39|nr:SpoIIE family protein phosphatase [Yinghuangia sp. ASG 101]UGQ10313.1 SpoIIE family protein phosphatase [Yinghuangia sp. ASG 101]
MTDRIPPRTPSDRSAAPETATLAATVDRLRAEVDGLRRAMRSRGVIEQAKGMLMGRMSCTADEAFSHLAQLSQHTNMKLVEVAAGLLGVAAPPPRPASPDTPPGSARRVPGGTAPSADARPSDRAAGARGSRAPGPGAPPVVTGLDLGVPARAATEAARPEAPAPLSSEEAARYHLTASALDTAADGDDVARLIGTEALGGADAVAIALLEPDGALRLAGTYGMSAHHVSQWRRIPPQAPLPLTEALREHRPVLVHSRSESARRYARATEALVPGEVICAVPLTDTDGTTHGAMSVSWPHLPEGGVPEEFTAALGQLCVGVVRRLDARADRAGLGAAPGDEMWFQALLDALLDPVVILTPLRDGEGRDVADFRVDHANAATVDLAGRTGTDVLGRRMTELYPGMVVSGVFERLLEVQRTGTPYEGDAEQFIEMVSGHLRSSTMTLRAVRFLDGVLLSWRIHDEDERRAAQLAQAQRLARLGTWQYDMGTGEMAWSPEMFAIVGLPAEPGPPSADAVAEVIDPEDLSAATAVLQELVTGHRPQTLEFRVRRADGLPCTVRAAAEAVCDPDGEEVIALRGVLQDVTAWRRAQEALAQARDQLDEERGRTAAQQEAVTFLQRAIVHTPDVADSAELRFAAHYVPAERIARVGGDWYDAVPLPDGRTLIAIGDVSGHGLPAAAGMTTVRHALRGMAYTGAEPAQILTWLNHMVCHQRSEYIATAVCALLNPATRTLTWAQAGHLPPLHIRDGRPRVLQPPFGMVLGASSDAAYGSGVVDLAPGDMVLMYTDGLIEHRGGDLGRGLSRLVGTVRENCRDGLDACVDHVMRHLGTPNVRDDTCLIGIQIPEA